MRVTHEKVCTELPPSFLNDIVIPSSFVPILRFSIASVSICFRLLTVAKPPEAAVPLQEAGEELR